MAESKKTNVNSIPNENKSTLQSSIKQGYSREISLYEDFFDKITGHAKTHRQISINNLKDAEKRIEALQTKAVKLADSIFFHDEEVVVERAKIISDTEQTVHLQNEDIMHHDRLGFDDTIYTIDYLSKALLQAKYDFFAFYSRNYLNNVLSTEDYFEYFMQKSNAFQVILDRHQNAIYDLFVKLDDQIKSMDESLENIIRMKNRKVTDIEAFYDAESKHYADNQLSFSAESDPTSIEVQALQSDKINQFNAFCEHAAHQNLKIQKAIEDDYVAIYKKVLNHLLQARSYQIINRFDLFDNPLAFKADYKQQMLDAEANRSPHLAKLLRTYQQISRWQKDIRKTEIQAAKMLKPQAHRKEQILKLSEETAFRQINQLELYLNEYLEVMKFDPFLAQVIGDTSSKIIKDELARLNMLKLNKELKTNIDFDIQAVKIKAQINELELIMMNSIKKEMLAQEGELLSEITKIHLFLLEKRAHLVTSSLSIIKERHLIERLDKATNEHLAFLVASTNTSRRYLSIISDELLKNDREKETHKIYVVEAKSELELALKQYQIKALHFQTMYENEKAYLVMQKSRVDEESKINNEFILTTYLNQMRFAQEQISLADSEYRIRLDSLMTTVDQERKYHQDQINILKNRYDSDIRLIQDDFQAHLYSETHKLEEIVDRREKKLVAIAIDKDRRIRDQKINLVVSKMENDAIIGKSLKELQKIDSRLEAAIKDADALREATISEFTDLYEHAKERYEVLKPYMENSVNILDPTFYSTLVSINDRYHEKIREAEAELDEKAEALLPHYREIFFTEDLKDHSESYRLHIDEIMAERELNQQNYQQKLQSIEANYQQQINSISREEDSLETSVISETESIRLREEATLTQFRNLVLTSVAEGESKIKAHRENTTKTINALTDEYFKSLKTSKSTVDMLSMDFQKMIDGYEEYLRFSEGEAKYRKVLKNIKKAARKKLNIGLRQINRRFNKYHVTPQK